GLAVGRAAGAALGVAAAIAGGFAVRALTSLEGTPADLTAAASPASVLVRDRGMFWWFAAVAGLPVGLVVGLLAGYPPGLSAGLGFELVPTNGLVAGLFAGLISGLSTGFAAGLSESAWGGFAVANCWLAARHRLPLRLVAFLDDAHKRRGVLRQAGAVYQFRHVELQRRLADR
nr:hypothetical protein [Micromonospora sp. DSM 115978]